MIRFMLTKWLHVRLAWSALCGRQAMLYDKLLRGEPVAYRISAEKIQAGDSAGVVECVASGSQLRDGISVGPHSLVSGCCVQGAQRYGLSG